MTATENSYWSIETCAWVRHPRAEAEVPVQRPAGEANEVVDVEVTDLDATDLEAIDLPSGVPV